MSNGYSEAYYEGVVGVERSWWEGIAGKTDMNIETQDKMRTEEGGMHVFKLDMKAKKEERKKERPSHRGYGNILDIEDALIASLTLIADSLHLNPRFLPPLDRPLA